MTYNTRMKINVLIIIFSIFLFACSVFQNKISCHFGLGKCMGIIIIDCKVKFTHLAYNERFWFIKFL